MKAIAFAVMALSIAVPTHSVASITFRVSPVEIARHTQQNQELNWNICAAFIENFSTYISPNALARLEADVYAGQVTWSVNSDSNSGGSDRFFSSGRVGWPDGEVIEFANEEDLETAVNLILNATSMSR